MSPSSDSPAGRLAGTLKFPTISSPEPFPLEPFHLMHEYAEASWPAVFHRLDVEVHGGASILMTWPGSSSELQPVMLTAHQDVVPPGEGWSFDPFGGMITECRILGRGAVDYKCGFAGMLEACENLLSGGFVPSRTVILAFGHDEEVGGASGAGAITSVLLERGIMSSSILDEGGYVFSSGNSDESAVISIAEKGYATFRITASAVQGHSSVPPERTAIGVLARAICVVEDIHFAVPSPPSGLPSMMPFLSTTAAPTVITGGGKENVLPGSAEVLINTRPAPGTSVQDTLERLVEQLSHLDVEVVLQEDPSLSEPSGFSSTETRDYRILSEAVSGVLGGSIPVVPGVFPAATDSRRYRRVAEQVYRFLPVRLGPSGISALHSVDESIGIEDYSNCVRFYGEYIRRVSTGS